MAAQRSVLVPAMLVAAFSLGACGDRDTGSSCDGICVAELSLTFSDGRETFQVTVEGDGFDGLSVTCPEGNVLGGPPEVSAVCTTAGIDLMADGYEFPESLTVTADNGDSFEISPSYEESTVCGSRCTSADVSL